MTIITGQVEKLTNNSGDIEFKIQHQLSNFLNYCKLIRFRLVFLI
jgi:hypothetical protein